MYGNENCLPKRKDTYPKMALEVDVSLCPSTVVLFSNMPADSIPSADSYNSSLG